MAMSSAERQQRWRDSRNEAFEAMSRPPQELMEFLLRQLGPAKTKQLLRALDKRMRAVDPKCVACRGTGYKPMNFFTPCGRYTHSGRLPCACDPDTQADAAAATAALARGEAPTAPSCGLPVSNGAS